MPADVDDDGGGDDDDDDDDDDDEDEDDGGDDDDDICPDRSPFIYQSIHQNHSLIQYLH